MDGLDDGDAWRDMRLAGTLATAARSDYCALIGTWRILGALNVWLGTDVAFCRGCFVVAVVVAAVSIGNYVTELIDSLTTWLIGWRIDCLLDYLAWSSAYARNKAARCWCPSCAVIDVAVAVMVEAVAVVVVVFVYSLLWRCSKTCMQMWFGCLRVWQWR